MCNFLSDANIMEWCKIRHFLFKPTRGLRQGDPLSPYLFVFCMERLGLLIQQQISIGLWKPVRLSRRGPKVSHLFFADDILLFGRATDKQLEVMKSSLEFFCKFSGQKVNVSKSKLYVSPNVNEVQARRLGKLTGIPITKDFGMYLGVPVLHSRVTRRTYSYLVEKVKRKLANWKIDSLSFAARATLVQTVTSTIPFYVMQRVKIAEATLKEIDRCNRRFLWGEKDGERKVHYVAWDQVCLPKECGGLGIRKISLLNEAALSKLG